MTSTCRWKCRPATSAAVSPVAWCVASTPEPPRQLTRFAFAGPAEELTLTKNCQPALFVHGLACLAAFRQEVGEFPVAAAAGLSLGEFTAHAAAGTFDFETGLRLVEKRGLFMQEACEQTQGSMAAMIGGDEETVRSLAAETDVDVANLNSPGQIVISGETANVALAVSLAKERGIRIAKLLNVAGAYHSRLMNSAFVRLGLASALQRLPVNDRWDLATALLSHAEDAADKDLPLLIWYGIEPAVAADQGKAALLLAKCQQPQVRTFITRRLTVK